MVFYCSINKLATHCCQALAQITRQRLPSSTVIVSAIHRREGTGPLNTAQFIAVNEVMLCFLETASFG
jgi:hypothetical protein